MWRNRISIEVNNYKQHLRWILLKDNRNRELKRWDGSLNVNGTFDIKEVILSNYQGIPAKIGIPTTEALYLSDNTGIAYGLSLSNSALFNDLGQKANVNNSDISLLFDKWGRTCSQIEDTYRERGTMAIGFKQEYKDGRGLLEERHFGHLNSQGDFVDEMTIYSLYLTDGEKAGAIGKYRVADITVTTVYDVDPNDVSGPYVQYDDLPSTKFRSVPFNAAFFGKETIYALSNNDTGINLNGNVYYSSKFGKGELPQGIAINYPNIRNNLLSLITNDVYGI